MGRAWYNPMTVTAPRSTLQTPPPRRYLRPVQPLHFPAEDAEEMGETPWHLELRTALLQAIRLGFAGTLTASSEQFVYWNGSDPNACCCPDVFVCLGEEQTLSGTWKTWEHGTPDLAIEIISASDARDRQWDEKIARYRELGCSELVRFDRDDAQRPLRIWDRVRDDLVERDPADPLFSRCDTLGAYFCVRNDARYGLWLYLARQPDGSGPYPSEAEARKREVEARKRETEARERAEAEVRRLQAELAKCHGSR
jgi:Uma2 family endonuclease